MWWVCSRSIKQISTSGLLLNRLAFNSDRPEASNEFSLEAPPEPILFFSFSSLSLSVSVSLCVSLCVSLSVSLSLFYIFFIGDWNKRGLSGRCHTAPRANIICASGNRSGAKERSMLWLTHVGLKVLVSSNRGFPTGTEETRLSEEQKQQQQQQQKQLLNNFCFVLLKCPDDCMRNLETKFRECRTNSEIQN